MSLETREDLDPVETTEWLESLESVLDREGEDRARYLMTRLADRLRRDGMKVPFSVIIGKSPMKTVWLLISPVLLLMNSAVTNSGAA